jgi:hypothetical protein
MSKRFLSVSMVARRTLTRFVDLIILMVCTGLTALGGLRSATGVFFLNRRVAAHCNDGKHVQIAGENYIHSRIGLTPKILKCCSSALPFSLVIARCPAEMCGHQITSVNREGVSHFLLLCALLSPFSISRASYRCSPFCLSGATSSLLFIHCSSSFFACCITNCFIFISALECIHSTCLLPFQSSSQGASFRVIELRPRIMWLYK